MKHEDIDHTGLTGVSDVSAHTGDTTDAHDASAISVADSGGLLTATDVEAALAEIAGDIDAHIADTSDAHDASAISFTPAGTIAATTVQAAIEEVASEGGGGGGGQSAWLVPLSVWMAQTVTNWATPVSANPDYNQSNGTQNDELVYEGIALDAGTWTFEGIFFRSTNHGIITVSLDGGSVGTIDLYNGGANPGYKGSITGIVIASADVFDVSLKMATKNASSSAYYGLVSQIQFRRTA